MAPFRRRRGRYGLDAPYAPFTLGGGAVLFGAVAAYVAVSGSLGAAAWPALGSACLLACTASYVYTTRSGKFRAWWRLLAEFELRGDERVLDLGCGRGAVLLMAAELLPRGRAVGVDLWSCADQSGNCESATRENAAAEGVGERVELETGDMRSLPFADGSFDLVVSSLAIHNIPDAAGRQKAIDEAARILKKGGRLAIADFRRTVDYAARLRAIGFLDVVEHSLGWRFWYGGPWAATRIVTARKAY